MPLLSSSTIQQAFSRYYSLIDDWQAFVDALARPLPVSVWAHPERISPTELEELLKEAGLSAEPISWYPGAFRLPAGVHPGHLWAYKVGLFHVQEEASLLPAVVLAPQPGERVLDMAAAPGGKTAQIALRMLNRGTVVANDVGPARMRALRHTLERLGALNVSTTIFNAANLPKTVGMFDRILVDAPCSCEGTVRKNPEIIFSCGLNTSLKHQKLQVALLRKAIQLCKPGGRIVYSTCTFAPEENEMVVDRVVREFGPERVHLLPVHVPGFKAASGLASWAGVSFIEGMENTLRVWPHQQDTGGFFIALLEKGEQGWEEKISPLPTVEDVWPERIERPQRWLTFLHERFGLSPSLFEPYVLLRRSKRNIHIVNREHTPPQYPVPDALGMVFMHTKSRIPKLTTAAALAFGRWATKNVIALTASQRDAYLSRQSVSLTREQVGGCTSPGYVLVSYKGHILGLGYYRAGNAPRLESHFPKGWMRG